MITELKGQIDRIIYSNEEDGYTIAKVKVESRSDPVTVVGKLLSPTLGEILKMKGQWTNHPKYGKQFKISDYETMIPASVHGIEKYLGSGLIKGIGPVMAKRIVEKFGTDTLDVIERDINRLAKVDGVFCVDEEGIIHAAGRFLITERVRLFLGGLGTRHRSAAGISKKTKTTAFVISETDGKVRAIRDGKVAAEIEADKEKGIEKMLDKLKY